MKKVLITGGSGLLGQYLNLATKDNFNIYTVFFNNIGNCERFPSSKINIRNETEIKQVFKDFKPQTVIHTAAVTNPLTKDNQTSKDYFDTNVTATKNIAELCHLISAKLIYLSTDLVYAGYRDSYLKEESKLIPATLYAETKLMGEVKVKEAIENHIILRTALLYGIGLNHSRCHFQFMYNNLMNKKPVGLFTDQFRTPISLKDASRLIGELVISDLKNETINLGGVERVSRYELGEILCDVAGFDKKLIEKIRMDDILNFPKVEDVSLNTDKLQSFGLKSRTIEENIYEIVKSF